MKKLIVLAAASLMATTAMAGEMKWSGSVGTRFTMLKQNDSLNTKNGAGKDTSITKTRTWQNRANIGVSGGWDNVEWGVGMRTNSSATSDWVQFNNNADYNIGLEHAWFRYMKDFGSVDFSVTMGRQNTVFAYDQHSENFWDKDVRWDGFGWQWKFGMFGLNAAQYVKGASSQGAATGASTLSYTDATDAVPTTQSKFSVLYGFQPHMTWKFSDEIETFFAVGYYHHSGFIGYTNTSPNYSGNTANTQGSVIMDNSKHWQFLNTWTLPYNLSAAIEYVMNKQQKYSVATSTGGNYLPVLLKDADKNAWAATLAYGKVKKAHDWMISYTYGNKGLGSVYSGTTKGQWAVDNKGHMIKAGYALADNFNLSATGYFLQEKAKKGSDGLAYTNRTENNKENRYEFVAGVSF